MRPVFYLILFLAFIQASFSQEIPFEVYQYIEEIIEQNQGDTEEEINVESVFSNLEELLINPVNLNTCSTEDLEQLIMLNDFQIRSLLAYRKQTGQIETLKELYYVYGFTESTVNIISPFVRTTKQGPSKNTLQKQKKYHHEMLVRATQSSTTEDTYKGNKQKYYARYMSEYKKFKTSLIGEKDAGEEFFSGSNKNGFDFYSGYISYTPNKTINKLVLGDYRVMAGQGLLYWMGYSTGTTSSTSSMLKRGKGISGNTSADERNFLRGVAVNNKLGIADLTLFVSKKNIDVTLDTVESKAIIRTIRSDGLHRTATEISYEKAASEWACGGRFQLSQSYGQIGINFMYTAFSKNIIPDDATYKAYNFTGTEVWGFSADYKYLSERFQFFGETALSNNAWSNVTGINLLPHPDVTSTLVYRNYRPGYFSPYASPISASSSQLQEEGFLGGITWHTNWKVNLSAYADIYSFPWLKYRINSPSSGKAYSLEGKWSLASDVSLILRYKRKIADKNYNEGEGSLLPKQIPFNKEQLRIHFNYSISDNINMATRAEYAISNYENETKQPGYLLYQDVFFDVQKALRIKMRYSWFDIDDYESRIYAYEHNARFNYSMPMYYGKGYKTYVLLQYKIKKNWSFWARYSFTGYFSDKENAHSGLIQIFWKL